jgi:5-methylcytosine-specific restriction endonuclease McrA
MRQHHTQVHGDPLPNRTCKGCETDFYDPKARKTFCEDCNPEAGKHNGNWRDAKEETTCERCGERFEYYPSDKKGVYCPECVAEADEFLGDHYAEVHDIDRIERTCDYCETEMTVLASERKYGIGRFCSRECLSEWMSENRSGKNHHNWLTGSRTYAGLWWEAREKALERDDYRCQNCGKSADEIGQNPDVHHITPLADFEDPQDAHRLENLIVLCRQCHAAVESGETPVPTRKERPSEG